MLIQFRVVVMHNKLIENKIGQPPVTEFKGTHDFLSIMQYRSRIPDVMMANFQDWLWSDWVNVKDEI